MPSAVSPRPQPQTETDDLDDLFADLIGNDANNHTGQNINQSSNAQPNDIDEEIKVKKARKPIAKLDEDRYALLASMYCRGDADRTSQFTLSSWYPKATTDSKGQIKT